MMMVATAAAVADTRARKRLVVVRVCRPSSLFYQGHFRLTSNAEEGGKPARSASSAASPLPPWIYYGTNRQSLPHATAGTPLLDLLDVMDRAVGRENAHARANHRPSCRPANPTGLLSTRLSGCLSHAMPFSSTVERAEGERKRGASDLSRARS